MPTSEFIQFLKLVHGRRREFFQGGPLVDLNPDLRRVWPFGGIFCLTFFREGCSLAARLDEPPLFLRLFNQPRVKLLVQASRYIRDQRLITRRVRAVMQK